MRWANPEYLLGLLFIIPLLFWGNRKKTGISYSSIAILQNLPVTTRLSPRIFLKILRVLAITLFVLALARPQTGKKFTEIPSAGVDIILAMDTSESMMGLDFKIDGRQTPRLEVVKNVATEFVGRRSGDRIGVVVFGEEAYTLAPLTTDHSVVVDFISRIKSGMAGNKTAIGAGLGVAINRMKGLPGKSKIVILLTDGVNNSGRIPPLVAAQIAAQLGVKVYTIGAGSKGQVPYRVETPLGPQQIYRQADLDEETLKRIAQRTGGKYFQATDTTSLQQTYQEIDTLEKTEVKVTEYTEYTDHYHWFLMAGIVALLMEIVLSQTLLRKLP
jgi:Ca-activated chloride channel family protein